MVSGSSNGATPLDVMPGAGGEDVGFGVPHSHKTTPGGGVAAQGY